MKPIVIDLFCGLGGWSKGFIAEGYHAIGFDLERHRYPARALEDTHVKCPGADWNHGDSFNGTNAKRWREAPLTGGWHEYPGELVLQDVHTLHGRQFKDAACIVASPPCQEFSYMAMPWKRAKQIATALRGDGEFPEDYKGSRTVAQLTALFDACFRIQREASEAAGRHIPMVVENVKGAQPWVGRAQANYGSFYLWGDVRSVGGRIVPAHRVEFGAPGVKAVARKNDYLGGGSWFPQGNGSRVEGNHGRDGNKNGHIGGGSWFAIGSPGQTNTGQNPDGRKVPMNFHEYEKTGKPGRSFQSAAVESVKVGIGDNYDRDRRPHLTNPAERNLERRAAQARKAASAMIAEIPFELSSWVARCFKPEARERVA